MSDAVSGPGWLLRHNGTLIAEVLDIDGPEQKADKDEVTNQSSPDNYKEWITTLLDGGDVKFKCNYIPGDTSQIGLLTALQGRGLEPFTITSPDTAHVTTFEARVMQWGQNTPFGKKAELDITLAVSGPVAVT